MLTGGQPGPGLTSATAVTSLDIAHRRLAGQWLADPRPGAPADVVDWLLAVQAQDFAGAKWAVGMRLEGVPDARVESDFAAGDILRTHVLRPTWHFVTPADIRWLLALTAPRVQAANAPLNRKLELGAREFRLGNDALARALQGRRHLTRQELRPILQQAGIAVDDGLRLGYVLMQAELDGVICSGPRRGKQFTYALLEERAPQARHLHRQEALAELARRYFFSRGPATVQDLARWSGLTVADARDGLEAVKAQLEAQVVDGQELWFRLSALAPGDGLTRAWLLSIWDEYIGGYRDRSAIMQPEVSDRIRAEANAVTNVIVVDGQIVGSWKRTLTRAAAKIRTEPWTGWATAEQQAVAEAARRFGQFFGLPVELE